MRNPTAVTCWRALTLAALVASFCAPIAVQARGGGGRGGGGAGVGGVRGVNPGGLGGPASGAGVRPGAGVGAPGAGYTRAPGVNPGGLGGPASGAGVRPGAGFGAPGVGLTRAPGARGVWNPAWGQRGYWGSRPWRVGWYRVNPVAWHWWGPSSLAWGATSLATAAAVSSMVDQAVAAQATAFTVPSTSYQLDYASLQAVAPYGASFTYLEGGAPLAAQVDCQQGWLNGAPPSTADQAQLLNAACLVAYGNGS
ncbi:hypothetical protein KBY88_13135 [Cyanobium sp. Morenito 9A2]|nr:hypothetical protein [Cyanobium sp. Morenito 9A2]